MINKNSKDYWDNRFRTDWESNGGRAQSRFFAEEALRALPQWFVQRAVSSRMSVLDWGCALGDGTHLLAQQLPSLSFTGCDFSESAVAGAKEQYPELSFIQWDVLGAQTEVSRGQQWDIVFSSNTLEHFREPWKVLGKLANHARRALVLMLPYREFNRIDEHYFTFSASNVPAFLVNGFALCHAKPVDVSVIPQTMWAGEQICLIYVRSEDPIFGSLVLGDVSVCDEPTAAGIVDDPVEQQLLASLARDLASSRAACNELEGALQLEQSAANARIAERDELLVERDSLWSALAEKNRELSAARLSLLLTEGAASSNIGDNERVRIEIEKLHSKANSLMDEIANRDAVIARLRLDFEGSMGQTKVLRTEVVARDEVISKLQTELEKLQDEAKVFRNEIVARDGSIAELRASVAAEAERAAICEKASVEMQAVAADLASQRAVSEELLSQLGARVRELSANWEDSIRENSSYRSRVVDLEGRELALSEECAKLREAAALREKVLSESYARNMRVEKGMLSMRQEIWRLKVDAEFALENLERKIAAMDSETGEIIQSKSWRLTRPLRRFISMLRGDEAELKYERDRTVRLTSRLREIFSSVDSQSQFVPTLWSDASARKVFIFTGVPFDDIGGGQRAAQLARVLLARGERVVYVYAYRKWEGGVEVESHLQLPGLQHVFLDATSVEEILAGAGADDVAIFELPHVRFSAALDLCNSKGVRTVFELIDAWDSSLGGDWFTEEIFSHFIATATEVVGTAKVLQAQLARRGRSDALYLPNAANESIFDIYRTYPRPFDIEEGWRSILYFGSLYGEWFDWRCVELTAQRCQDSIVYLIGDPPAGVSMPDNVRFLGSKKIDDLPAYLRHCDVAILPFKPGHISDAVSPIKVFEYLYMGVPVVSNDLPEVNGYPNLLVASTPEEFAQLCANPPAARAPIDDFVMQNSWASRVDRIVPPRMAGKSVSAIILMHNNAGIIGRCLESLRLHGGDFLRQVIVVDNASSDAGCEIVERDFPEVLLLRNSKNGCSSGRNLGLANATSEYIVFLDSDQWLTGRGCFEEALMILDHRPDIGAVGWAAGWFADGNEDFGGPIVDYLPERGIRAAQYAAEGVRTDIAYLGSGGLFMRREDAERIGGFDEFYDPTCFEDTDYSLTIKNAGLLIAYRNLQGIRHQAHQTTGASGHNASYQQLFKRNAAYFGKKWKHRPEFFFDRSVLE